MPRRSSLALHPLALIRLIALVYSVGAMIIFPKWTVDDAYITMRYADNLARHGELNWNVGEDPVEGYTGFVLPVLLAGAIKVGLSPLVIAKLLSIIAYYCIPFLLLHALRIAGCGAGVQTVVWTFYLFSPLMFTHVFSGLETMLFSAAITASFVWLLKCARHQERSKRDETIFSLLLLLSGLLRPEGVLLAIFLGGALVIERSKVNRASALKFLGRFAVFYILPASLYFLWRYNYYGHLLPNTFYAKADSGWNAMSIRSFLRFAYTYLSIPLIGLAMWAALAANLGRANELEPPEPKTSFKIPAIATLLYVAGIFLQYFRSVPLMNYSFRFFAPFYPLLLILLAMAWSSISLQLTLTTGRRIPLPKTTLLIFALGLVQLVWNIWGLGNEMEKATRYKNILEDEHVEIGKRLKKAVPPSEWLVVYMDSGAIPYYGRLKTVDLGLLNDERLSRQDMPPGEILDYVFSHKPAVFVFTSTDWHHVVYKPDWSRVPDPAVFMSDARFGDYVLAQKFRSERTSIRPDYEFVYLRRDLAGRW